MPLSTRQCQSISKIGGSGKLNVPVIHVLTLCMCIKSHLIYRPTVVYFPISTVLPHVHTHKPITVGVCIYLCLLPSLDVPHEM